MNQRSRLPFVSKVNSYKEKYDIALLTVNEWRRVGWILLRENFHVLHYLFRLDYGFGLLD